MLKRTTLAANTKPIAEWTTSQDVDTEQQFKEAWQTANDLALVLGHRPIERSYKEAGFVQAFVTKNE